MSPEPEVEVSYSEVNIGTLTQNGANLPATEIHSRRRERRLLQIDNFAEPLSPASSSATNTATDITFEPTIDMMVNDFDDEQTLNEEEALAALEQQDPQNEIETLREESEMPIEMLMEKYALRPEIEEDEAPQHKKAKTSKKKTKYKRHAESTTSSVQPSSAFNEDVASSTCTAPKSDFQCNEDVEENEVIIIESGDEELVETDGLKLPEGENGIEDAVSKTVTTTKSMDGATSIEQLPQKQQSKEKAKPRRSHLLDLYPDQSFDNAVDKEVVKETRILGIVYDEEEEDEDGDDDDEADEEGDNDYVKKTIMVGSAYQAVIPEGLSQYGDVLPYENEDKLIWEPCQVSEQEVELYLLKARDMKPTITEALPGEMMSNKNVSPTSESNAVDNTVASNDIVNLERPTSDSKYGVDGDFAGIIKDNEQALHLLVQCGYDFKEALRRKRLNALPLNDTMSIWSEEECHKFEEGIQKFGKDFFKIRQNQVRTRTMRELVQFYYFWKKSDRRDHEFANADTVDHMDIYLNEGDDYGPNVGSTGTCYTGGTNAVLAPSSAARKSIQKNFSIMTGNNTCSSVTTATSNGTLQIPTNTKVNSNRKRAGVTSSSNGATLSSIFTANQIPCNETDTQS